jgi:hypothetical protein
MQALLWGVSHSYLPLQSRMMPGRSVETPAGRF